MASLDKNNPLGISSARADSPVTDSLFNDIPSSVSGDSAIPIAVTPSRSVTPVTDDLFDDLPTNAPLNVETSRDVNPDEFVEQKNLAEKTGVPVEVVEAAPDFVKAVSDATDTERVFKGSPATSRFFENPNNAKAAHDAVKELGVIERISRGFQRGETISRLGLAGVRLRSNPESLEKRNMVALLKQRLQALGEDTEGFVSGLAGVTEFFGQRKEALDRPRASAMTAAGTAMGASLGLAGGPFAPITSTVGGAVGLASGFVAHNIMDAGEVEAGLAYVEQIEAGVDPRIAYVTSLGVGILNGGLEAIGFSSFLRPLTISAKTAIRQGLRGVVRNKAFIEAAKNLSVNYAANVSIETATEVTQEVVNIAAEELAKTLDQGLKAEWTPDEWEERLAKIAIKTIKTTALLAAPGNTIAFMRDVRKVRQAEAVKEKFVEMKTEGLEQSPLTERSPAQAAEHVAESFQEVGVEEVFIPVEALSRTALETGDPVKFYADLGVTDQIENAEFYNGDIRISVARFSEHIYQTDLFTSLQDHIRIHPEDLTVAEGQEQTESLELEAAEAAIVLEKAEGISEETQETVQLAEHEAGVQQVYKTADEAGFTEKGYSSYLEAWNDYREGLRQRKEGKRLNRLKKKLTKEYNERVEKIAEEQSESVSQEPLYQAQLAATGNNRLDFEAVKALLSGDEKAMKALPRVNGQRIYAPKSQRGLNPNIHADLYGFEGGDIMLFQFLDNPAFEEAVQQRTETVMEQEFPVLVSERAQINEALEALHTTDDYGNLLTLELTQMREARGQGRLAYSLIKARAKELLEKEHISNINIRQLEARQRREARRARQAIRQGDIVTAAQAKLNQILAFEMTKQAYKVRPEIAKGNKYMRGFLNPRKKFASLPVSFRDAIQDMLSKYQLGPRTKEVSFLKEWADRKLAEGVAVEIPKAIEAANGLVNFQDLTLGDWRTLRNTVRNTHKQGVEENSLRKAEEKRTVSDIVAVVSEGVQNNLSRRGPREAKTVEEVAQVSRMETNIDATKDTAQKWGINVSAILLNADSILRNIDGFQSLGVAYTFIKGGIDKAITEGYFPEQVGYVARMKQESKRLVKLFDMYSKREQVAMHVEFDIPGVRMRLTRSQWISVLLNMGNAENIEAMIESGQFTEDELQSLVSHSRKLDLDFAQAVWDYFEEFAPEIQETVRRRQNRNPVMVEAQTLITPFGEYRGGYFPLKYDYGKILEGEVPFEEAKNRMLFGNFSLSHTQDDHTQTRKGSGGRAVKFDPFVINNHIQQLMYDIEVGDAANDAYKVLHNEELRDAFNDAGQADTWKALDLWLGDAITGEIHRGSAIQKAFRHIRTGTTISALAYNFSVAALQPLGLLQSAALIGKRNMIMGFFDLISSDNPYALYQWVTDQSGFMREREQSFNKDIVDAQTGLKTGLFAQLTPGKSANFIADTMFMPIAKMQRFVDIVTWLGAKRQGMEMFKGDLEQSTLHADRMVARTQGSGNFQERTGFERGTIDPSHRNSEMVRAWSLFLNYFAAKLNVAYERTKTTNFMDPVQFVNWAVDMLMLFFVEGLLASLIKEGVPEDEEDDEVKAWTSRAAFEGMKTFAAGVPIAREAVAAAEGFDTGGAIGSFAGKLARASKQVSQRELDAAAVKNINSVLGVLFHYPTSQIHKTGQAIYDVYEGEDVDFIDFVMGPQFRND